MSSTYCTWTDVEYLFGKNQTAAWAAFDGDTAYAAARKTAAIAHAGEEIDAVLRVSKYSNNLPISVYTGTTTITPPLIRDIAAVLAGLWLYDGLGLKDRDEEGRPFGVYEYRRQWARETLAQIREGLIDLGAVC